MIEYAYSMAFCEQHFQKIPVGNEPASQAGFTTGYHLSLSAHLTLYARSVHSVNTAIRFQHQEYPLGKPVITVSRSSRVNTCSPAGGEARITDR
jgi:hypothetical protein